MKDILDCYQSATTGDVEQRLHVMEGEWDLDRTVQIALGALSVAGLFAAWKRPRWMALPLALQTLGLLGLVPGAVEPVRRAFRAIGFRSALDIDRERRALGMLGIGDMPGRIAQASRIPQV